MLTHRSDIGLVSTAADAEGALVQARRFGQHVALVDMAWDQALRTVSAICRQAVGARVVGLGLSEFPEDRAIESIQAGLSGYVSPSASLDELVATITRVSRGEMICAPRITAALAHRLARLGGEGPTRAGRLTGREGEVAHLLDRGLSNKEIATALNIEVPTVKNHIHNILEKLRVHRRGEAVAQLRRWATPSGPYREFRTGSQ